jgi:hypothetical protein
LTAEDLPLHRLQDETDRNSPITTATNDRVSSQGAFDALFTKIPRKSGKEHCGDPKGHIFHSQSGYPVRQVEPRNTPSIINAVFSQKAFDEKYWAATTKYRISGGTLTQDSNGYTQM